MLLKDTPAILLFFLTASLSVQSADLPPDKGGENPA
jgi:hypothetical protein